VGDRVLRRTQGRPARFLQHARAIRARPSGCVKTSEPMRAGCRPDPVLSTHNALTEFLRKRSARSLSASNVSVEPRRTPQRRDRRLIGRRRCRSRHCRVAPSTPAHWRPFRSQGPFVLVVAAIIPWLPDRRFALREVLDHDFVGLDRASALQRFLAGKAARIGRPLRLPVAIAQFRCGVPPSRMQCRIGIVPESTATTRQRAMAITAVTLTDAWACREAYPSVSRVERSAALRRQLVEHLRRRLILTR